jgi:hypothetical protein
MGFAFGSSTESNSTFSFDKPQIGKDFNFEQKQLADKPNTKADSAFSFGSPSSTFGSAFAFNQTLPKDRDSIEKKQALKEPFGENAAPSTPIGFSFGAPNATTTSSFGQRATNSPLNLVR